MLSFSRVLLAEFAIFIERWPLMVRKTICDIPSMQTWTEPSLPDQLGMVTGSLKSENRIASYCTRRTNNLDVILTLDGQDGGHRMAPTPVIREGWEDKDLPVI